MSRVLQTTLADEFLADLEELDDDSDAEKQEQSEAKAEKYHLHGGFLVATRTKTSV